MSKVPDASGKVDEDRRFKSTELLDASASAMLDELLRWTAPLAALRRSSRQSLTKA